MGALALWELGENEMLAGSLHYVQEAPRRLHYCEAVSRWSGPCRGNLGQACDQKLACRSGLSQEIPEGARHL